MDESAPGNRKRRELQSTCTKLLQKNWEWQENQRKELEPGKWKYKTMHMASMDVETFDVSKPSVVSKILSLIGTHGALVAERCRTRKGRHVLRSARRNFVAFECIRQDVVEAFVLWWSVAKYVLQKRARTRRRTAHVLGVRWRERLGFAVQGGLRYWGTVFNVMEKAHKGSKRHCAQGYIYRSKSFFDNEMPAGCSAASSAYHLGLLFSQCAGIEKKHEHYLSSVVIRSSVVNIALISRVNRTWNDNNARTVFRWETQIFD